MSSDVGRRLKAITRRYHSSNNPPTWGMWISIRFLLLFAAERPTMTVKIDRVEPNIFPPVEDLDARDAGRNVEVFLDVSVEGHSTPVTVKLTMSRHPTWPFFSSRFESPGPEAERWGVLRSSEPYWDEKGLTRFARPLPTKFFGHG
jgi:hypothetical protein